MRTLIISLLSTALVLTGCASPQGPSLDPQYARLSDKQLWLSMRSVGAFNELRCQGFTAKQANKVYDKRFAASDRAIDAAMLAKYGPPKEGEYEIIPIGWRCPAYRGAIRKSRIIRTELERRLGLRPAY